MKISIAKHAGISTAYPYYSEGLVEVNGPQIENFLTHVRDLKKDLKDVMELLLKEVRHANDYGIYFRGQNRACLSLLPSAGRLGYAYNKDQERNLLHRFRRESYGHYDRLLTDWETIFLARHHYLPCRLLEWSENPLVGLFWACYEDRYFNCDGALWVLVRQPDEQWDLNVFDTPLFHYKYAGDFDFLVKGVKLLYPFNVSPRITAQACIFTYQDNPLQPLTEYHPTTQKRKDFDIFHLQKWTVPKRFKKDLLKELSDIGINFQSMCPDVQGLGEGIPQVESLRRH